MIAALRTGRKSIGVEIDPEYCRMAARYLKAETANLFLNETLVFWEGGPERDCLVRDNQELYQVRPAKKTID
jgi:modification methylase